MLPFIEQVAREAGEVALRYFETLKPEDIHSKATARDMVSAADLAVEKAITARIRERFPDHGILGEESGLSNDGAEYRWVIDPIDGTQSFVKHHPYFSISIALCRGGETEYGVVYAPALNLLFAAEKGKGATRNGEAIHTSKCARVEDADGSTGFACIRAGLEVNNITYFSRIVPVLHDIKRCGSAALDLAMVGSGTYDCFWELALEVYDIAAGTLIAREAGAVVTDLAGGGNFPRRGILAAAPGVHGLLLPFFADYPEKLC